MQTDPNSDAEKSKQEQDDHIPYDGFVNVNDIVNKRRQLRNAQFNVADEVWDADFNPIPKQDPEEDSH